MATAASSKRARRRAAEFEDEPVRPRRRRRWLFSATVLVGLPAVLWFAPSIIGVGPILNRLVARATRDFQGSVSIGGASLGWLSPIVISNVDVRGAEGKQIVTIPLVVSSKTLLAILMNPRDLGVFKVDRPEVDLVLRFDGSNVEEALSHWLEPSTEQATRLGLSLVVSEGVAKIDDTVSGRQWQIDELGCELVVPADETLPLAVSASGRVTPAEPAGRFTLHLKHAPGGADARSPDGSAGATTSGGQGEVSVTSQALPLELLEPLLRRVAAESELSGTLEMNVNAQWNNDATAPRGELHGEVALTHLMLVGPWTGEDRLRLERLQIPCTLVRDGQRLEVRRCDVVSEIGHVTCAGTIDDLRDVEASWFKSLWSVLPHSQGEIKGTLDLAKLSRILPATLRVHEGMQIEEGAVNLDLTSGIANGRWECSGRLESTRLMAVEQGRQIAWDHPLLVTVAGHDTPQGPVIEQIKGESDFLKFEGSGTPDFFGLTANFELSRLVDELGQFLDFGELRLGGDGWSRLTWKRGADDSFEADAELQATNFMLVRPGKPAWSDPRLTVTASMKGQLEGRDIQRVESATMQMASATDEFTAALASPVLNTGSATVWPVETHLRGELQRWLARVEPWFLTPVGWDISGEADIVSTVRYGSDGIHLDTCQADFAKLHAWGPGLFIDESRLRVTGNGQLDRARNLVEVKNMTLTGADIAGRVQDFTVRMAETSGIERVGHAELQGNLTTLHRWTHDPRQPDELQVTGLVACTLHADLAERSPAFDLSATVEDLAATSRSGQSWRERQIRLMANTTYDETNDVVHLAQLEIESEALRLNASGRIDRWTKDRALVLNGKTNYDLEKLTLILQPYFGNEIRATGRESRSFSLAGPVGAAVLRQDGDPAARDAAIQQWDGKADFGWQTATLFGFDLAAGNLQGSLTKGTLQVAPTKLQVSGGTLNLAPVVRLAPGPATLILPAGVVLDNVKITPEMCQQWLMYVAPVLAGVTQVEGSFSVQLAGCQVPLAQPKAGEATGQVTVHAMDLEPGPVVRELASVLGAASRVNLAQQSKVDFKMVQGRVYHRGLVLQFPEVTVRTYGSVGLDETLAIMAEMNVPVAWIRDNALRENLKNQVIQIPIAGTLARPEIDQNKLAELRGKFVRDAAGGALRNELQRQMDRLLSPLVPKP